ncbi:MAG: phage tail protein, partial [Flavobacteriaceae bacterium]|nr:phage tail protein [Flavobacteriaceae bacterium]
MAQSKYNFQVGFHFKVEFTGIETTQNDHQFQSVSGLSIDLETEEIAERGENRFKHKIPVRTKFPNLVLKRGLLMDSGVIDWCL